MKISQEFTVARPIDATWAFFKDIPEVAKCLPGAEYLGAKDDGRHLGKISSKIGPFQASFEGEAAVAFDDQAKAVHVEGKGVDKKGASRGKMTLDCALTPVGDTTKVNVDADIQLAGAIAQFGRTNILTEVANVLIADFVRNVEAKLDVPAPAAASATSTATGDDAAPAPSASPQPAAATPISATSLLIAALKGWLRSLFGKRAA